MLLKGNKDFQIDIFRLANKQHEFQFEINDELFGAREHRIIDKGSGVCDLTVQKSETMMTLRFQTKVKVELICDRSLESFEYPISSTEEIVIKFGDDDYDLSENVFVIKKETPSIYVDDLIYEFISIAVPMKKLHPRFQAEEDETDLIYTSSSLSEQGDEKEIDPRWEQLKKLKGN